MLMMFIAKLTMMLCQWEEERGREEVCDFKTEAFVCVNSRMCKNSRHESTASDQRDRKCAPSRASASLVYAAWYLSNRGVEQAGA